MSGDSWTDYSEPSDGQWEGGGDSGGYFVAAPTPAPAPAPAPVYNEPAPVYNEPAPAPAPAQDWSQTVNDIYQQEFGRQADPSGMASFSSQLNQGLTGEQMRAALRSSAEGQSMGLSSSPAPAPYTPFDEKQYGQTTDQENEYINAARLANWQMEQGRPDMAQQYIDQANALKTQLDSPYRIDTITSGGGGDAGASAPQNVLMDRSGNIVSDVSPQDNGQYSVVAPGTGDAGASTPGGAFTLQDIIQQAESQKSAAFGTGLGKPLGYDYELKNEEGDPYRRYDAQGNLTEFVDRLTGNWTKTSDVKPVGTVFDPMQGKMVTEYEYGGRKFAPTESSGGLANAAFMDQYSKDTGGFMGEGGWSKFAALVATGLSAGIAGGAFAGAGLGATAGAAAANPILTAATQGALTSMAVSGAKGSSPTEMLKAGVIGAISAGLGPALGAADLGTIGTMATKIGAQAGITAATGGDVKQALISGVINSALPSILGEVLPKETISSIEGLPKPVQSVVMGAATSAIKAGFSGGDISAGAVNGVINSMINLGKDVAKGVFNNLPDSQSASTAADYFDKTPTASNDPYSPENIMAALTQGYQNAPSATGAPQYASATTSDVNPPSYGGDRYGAADTESPGGGDIDPNNNPNLRMDLDGNPLPEGIRAATQEEIDEGLAETYWTGTVGMPVVQVGTSSGAGGASENMGLDSPFFNDNATNGNYQLDSPFFNDNATNGGYQLNSPFFNDNASGGASPIFNDLSPIDGEVGGGGGGEEEEGPAEGPVSSDYFEETPIDFEPPATSTPGSNTVNQPATGGGRKSLTPAQRQSQKLSEMLIWGDPRYGRASKFGGEYMKSNEPWRYGNQLVGAPTGAPSESSSLSSLMFQQMLDKGYFDLNEGGQPDFLQEAPMQSGAPEGHNPEFFSEGGLQHRYAKGGGDGTSDSVPAMLATGEFVIPADVVSGLGNGDNEAGAGILDKFLVAIREHKRSTNPEELPPDSPGPLAYLEKAIKKAGK